MTFAQALIGELEWRRDYERDVENGDEKKADLLAELHRAAVRAHNETEAAMKGFEYGGW